MDIPVEVRHQLEPVVVGEPGGILRVCGAAAIICAAVLAPSIIAIVSRPQNATEGWVFLAVAVGLLAWQLRRLARSGVALDLRGIARRGATPVPWDQVADVHWHTSYSATRAGASTRVHRLRAGLVDGATVALTRWFLRDDEADRLAADLRGVGLAVVTPARNRTSPTG